MTFFLLTSAVGFGAYLAFGQEGSLFWEITRNSSVFMLFSTAFYEQGELLKETKSVRLFMRGVCFMFMYFFVNELSYSFCTYEEYHAAKHAGKLFTNMGGVLVVAAILILIDTLHKIKDRNAT